MAFLVLLLVLLPLFRTPTTTMALPLAAKTSTTPTTRTASPAQILGPRPRLRAPPRLRPLSLPKSRSPTTLAQAGALDLMPRVITGPFRCKSYGPCLMSSGKHSARCSTSLPRASIRRRHPLLRSTLPTGARIPSLLRSPLVFASRLHPLSRACIQPLCFYCLAPKMISSVLCLAVSEIDLPIFLLNRWRCGLHRIRHHCWLLSELCSHIIYGK